MFVTLKIYFNNFSYPFFPILLCYSNQQLPDKLLGYQTSLESESFAVTSGKFLIIIGEIY